MRHRFVDALQEPAKSRIPPRGWRVTYAVGNALLASRGTVVAMVR